MTPAKDLLRFAVIGSVDDGKSTLIGRLLFETGGVPRDHFEAVELASKKMARQATDLALLTDGLRAEREQGITIDVAYRRFATKNREYVIADVPGHEQYTRNMVSGVSHASLVVLLIDAAAGIRTQSKRHAFIASLLGVQHVVVAVNKMDLVGWSEEKFRAICDSYQEFCAKLTLTDLSFVPVCALTGDNIVTRSPGITWYDGPSIFEHLESVYVGHDRNLVDLRLPVQSVVRSGSFRGHAGSIASGVIRQGEGVMVMPGGQRSKVKRLLRHGVDVDYAFAPQPVTVVLDSEVDVGRGDMLVHVRNRPSVLRRFQAMLVWVGTEPLQINREYLVRCGTDSVRVEVSEIVYRVEPETLHREAAPRLELNEIGRVVVDAFRALVCDDFARNDHTGSFVLVDPRSCDTVAAGVIIERAGGPVRSAQSSTEPVSKNIALQPGKVDRQDRERVLGQRSATVWLTGLSGSGKTTIAQALEAELLALERVAFVLDGDNVRHGLNRDLGFAPADRAENIRRVAEVARLMQEAGVLVICAFISPYREDRDIARNILGESFLEVFVDAALETCEERDPRGLYAKARRGEIQDFTGVSAPYEPPSDPEVHLATDQTTVSQSVGTLVDELRRRGILAARD